MGNIVKPEWNLSEVLVTEDRYKCRRFTMAPGQGFNYQYHNHRRYFWVVVSGSIMFGNHEGKEQLVPEGEAMWSGQGGKYKMMNAGKIPAVLIEVQYGSYLGDDDLVRLDDARLARSA